MKQYFFFQKQNYLAIILKIKYIIYVKLIEVVRSLFEVSHCSSSRTIGCIYAIGHSHRLR